MKHAYADRSKLYLGDPDFYQVPVSKLINKTICKNIKNIKKLKSNPSSKIKPGSIRRF